MKRPFFIWVTKNIVKNDLCYPHLMYHYFVCVSISMKNGQGLAKKVKRVENFVSLFSKGIRVYSKINIILCNQISIAVRDALY